MTLPSRITAKPSSAPAPSWVLVCYDFDGATSPVTLSLVPSGGGNEIVEQVSVEEPCVRYHVEAGTTSVVIVDESGQSSDAAILVTP